jgi:hypothetical protein
VVVSKENMKIERNPRGTMPPYLPLAEAFELTKKIYEQGGGIASYNLISQLTGNSTSSSSFNRKLSALRGYGLATDQNKTITLTDKGNAIAAPQTPEGALQAKKDAFLSIEVFVRIYDRHRGKLLPADEFLRNIIEQDCKIPRELSEAWVSAFKEAARATGLLLDRADGKTQILDSPILSEGQSRAVSKKTIVPFAWEHSLPQEIEKEFSTSVPISASGHHSKIEVSGGRYAEFRIPDKLTARDAQKIKKALVGYEAILDSMVADESEENASKNG